MLRRRRDPRPFRPSPALLLKRTASNTNTGIIVVLSVDFSFLFLFTWGSIGPLPLSSAALCLSVLSLSCSALSPSNLIQVARARWGEKGRTTPFCFWGKRPLSLIPPFLLITRLKGRQSPPPHSPPQCCVSPYLQFFGRHSARSLPPLRCLCIHPSICLSGHSIPKAHVMPCGAARRRAQCVVYFSCRPLPPILFSFSIPHRSIASYPKNANIITK